MTNSPRAEVRRKLEQSIGHIEFVQGYLIDIAPLYADAHPEIVEQLKVINALASNLKDVIKSFRETY